MATSWITCDSDENAVDYTELRLRWYQSLGFMRGVERLEYEFITKALDKPSHEITKLFLDLCVQYKNLAIEETRNIESMMDITPIT